MMPPLPFDDVALAQGVFVVPAGLSCRRCRIPVTLTEGFPGRIVECILHHEPMPHYDVDIGFFCRSCIVDVMKLGACEQPGKG